LMGINVSKFVDTVKGPRRAARSGEGAGATALKGLQLPFRASPEEGDPRGVGPGSFFGIGRRDDFC
jgi:hypothetical protein